MKLFVAGLLVVFSTLLQAQSIGIRAGHTRTPASQISLRYAHWSNGAVHLSLAGFFERSRRQSLNYRAYGIDLLTVYTPQRALDNATALTWHAGLGATWQLEKEPWLYKDLPHASVMNYGLVGELSASWRFTDVFQLQVFAQQKILLRSRLGSLRQHFGIGLDYLLSGY